MQGERFVYLNGEIIEEQSARISPFDRGFLWGDGVYEVTPCFAGKLYRLDDHLDRLYRSLKYVRIDVGFSKEEMKRATPGYPGVEFAPSRRGRHVPCRPLGEPWFR